MNNIYKNCFNISIIIPTQNDLFFLTKCIKALTDQSVYPKEIILIDSSTDNNIPNYVSDLKFENIKLIYKKIPKSYAGRSIIMDLILLMKNLLAYLIQKPFQIIIG